ncbi:hypothetical protein GN958_ATG09635 [Phytophthora infestans]|uniref:Uncharacterized protein n=1 Tax=Phytophthora infestans TaxID=4787 RepID=A0A8S9USL3_PHYIN|nr:hypothetical protein GN958_ATG09635 [Phytophthora infestans]
MEVSASIRQTASYSDTVISDVVQQRSKKISQRNHSRVNANTRITFKQQFIWRLGEASTDRRHDLCTTGKDTSTGRSDFRSRRLETANSKLWSDLIIADKLRLRELRRVRQIRYRKKKERYADRLDGEQATTSGDRETQRTFLKGDDGWAFSIIRNAVPKRSSETGTTFLSGFPRVRHGVECIGNRGFRHFGRQDEHDNRDTEHHSKVPSLVKQRRLGWAIADKRENVGRTLVMKGTSRFE